MEIKPLLTGLLYLLLYPSAHAQTQADGYKGIWFTLGQPSAYGDKYSGGLGTYTANHVPMAVYAPKARKTFFVFGGTPSATERTLQIMVSYYDHRSGMLPKPIILLEKTGVNDPHDNPSINIDHQGYIWIFVSGRNTRRPGSIYKSNFPYDITSFTKILEDDITYPQPWPMAPDKFIHLFTRYTNGRELYWTTSTNGLQWATPQKLAGFGGHYQISTRHQQTIFTAFNYHPNGDVDKRTNIYLLMSSSHGQKWTNIDHIPLPTPITKSVNDALVHNYESEGKLVYLNDLNTDKNGNPVILAVISRDHRPGPQGNPREWVIWKRQNNQWVSRTICTSSHNYDMGSIYIKGKHWTVIGPTQTGPQRWGTGGEMAIWSSHDEGNTWSMTRQLTQNSAYNHSYARRPLNAHKDFYAFWGDGHADTLSPSKLYFTTKRGIVYQLPYQMTTSFTKPIKYKAP